MGGGDRVPKVAGAEEEAAERQVVQHEPESEEAELLPKLEPGGEGTGERLARSATDELDETGDRTGEVGKREHRRSAAGDDLWGFGGVGWGG